MAYKFLDIFYPPRCALCDEVIEIGTDGVCDACRTKLSFVEEPRCLKCGKEIESLDLELCEDCKTNQRLYIKGFPVFNYTQLTEDSMAALKFRGKSENAAFYGKEIAKKFGRTFVDLQIDCFIPVPIHRERRLERGYNQAELIAKELSSKTGIPYRTDILYRTVNTKAQKLLGSKERENNLKKAFVAKRPKNSNIPNVVCLVDDIYTTGSTIEACTETCMEIGIKKVYYTSACIGRTLMNEVHNARIIN